MGQPPSQGAEKQLNQGTGSSDFRLGRGLTGLTWRGSKRQAPLRAAMAAVSVPVKGAKGRASVFSQSWASRL